MDWTTISVAIVTGLLSGVLGGSGRAWVENRRIKDQRQADESSHRQANYHELLAVHEEMAHIVRQARAPGGPRQIRAFVDVGQALEAAGLSE